MNKPPYCEASNVRIDCSFDADSKQISELYNAYIINHEDVVQMLNALRKSGLQRQGVKILTHEKYPLYVWVVVPKKVDEEFGKYGVYAKILLYFTPIGFTQTYARNVRAVKDPFCEIIDTIGMIEREFPEIEGIF